MWPGKASQWESGWKEGPVVAGPDRAKRGIVLMGLTLSMKYGDFGDSEVGQAPTLRAIVLLDTGG